MTPRTLSGLALSTEALPGAVVRRRRWRAARAMRRRLGWLLVLGWIVLPLLPLIGLGVSRLLGVN